MPSLLVAICLLAGNGYFAKGLIIDTIATTFIRSIVASVAIGLWLVASRESITLARTRDYAITAVSGVLLGAHWLLFFYSMKVSTVTLGMTALFTYPMITLWLEKLAFGKAIVRAEIGMTVLIVAGVWTMGVDTPVAETNNAYGVFLGLLSALCFAARNLIQQYYLSCYSAHKTVFYQTLVIAIIMSVVCHSYLQNDLNKSDALAEWPQWILLGVLFTALPHSLVAHSIKMLGSRSVAMISCAQPVIGSVIAFILLGEVATSFVALGALVVVCVSFYEIYLSSKAA